MDARQGFEPWFLESNSSVLPLDERAMEPCAGFEPTPAESQSANATLTPSTACWGYRNAFPVAADFSTPAVSQQTIANTSAK